MIYRKVIFDGISRFSFCVFVPLLSLMGPEAMFRKGMDTCQLITTKTIEARGSNNKLSQGDKLRYRSTAHLILELIVIFHSISEGNKYMR